MIEEIIKFLSKFKLENIESLNAESNDYVFKDVIICTCLSNRQVDAMVTEMRKFFKSAHVTKIITDYNNKDEWGIVASLSLDVGVHFMTSSKRKEFDLQNIITKPSKTEPTED